MPIAADFVIEHASLVATCAGRASARRGTAGDHTTSRRIGRLSSGVIVYVGPSSDAERELELHNGAVRLDASRCTVVPGFVDPHTHVVFAGDRQDELRQRLGGATHESIAAAGGGIKKTVALTRSATEADLASAAGRRLDEMLAAGTTTREAKYGYGLPSNPSSLSFEPSVSSTAPTPSTSRRRSSAHTIFRPSSRRAAVITSPASSTR